MAILQDKTKEIKRIRLGFGYESSSVVVVVVVASFTREALAGSREKLSSIRRVTRGSPGLGTRGHPDGWAS